jgi:antitoxin (DNA-binding transcriptional repressor) of toxin-antitoxin stability system
MSDVSVADAKAHLSEILRRVEMGETVRITRRGKPIIMMNAIERPRKPIDFDRIDAFVATLPADTQDSGKLLRRMRDDGF